MRVIDSHVHFPEDKIIDDGLEHDEKASSDGIGYSSGNTEKSAEALKPHQAWLRAEKNRWESAWRFPEPVAVSKEHGEALWLSEFEKYPYLEKVVFVTAGSNQFASELSERNPGRFIGYAHHNPMLKDAPDRLEKAVKVQKLRGYKLLGPKVEKPLSDPFFDPLWETAQDLQIPVLIHFGIMGAAGGIASHINMNPMAIHDAAKRFPDIPFIIPHFGTGYLFEVLNLCWACPNVYIDTSGSNQWMRWMPYEVSLEILFRKFRETIGPSRLIFGTDSSWFPRGFSEKYLDEQNRAMSYVGFSDDEKDMVLYRNIAALLKIQGN